MEMRASRLSAPADCLPVIGLERTGCLIQMALVCTKLFVDGMHKYFSVDLDGRWCDWCVLINYTSYSYSHACFQWLFSVVVFSTVVIHTYT